MNPYYNLPPEQRRIQQLADQFNADERLWEELEPKRNLRRTLLRGWPKKNLHELDLLEFARACPPRDCIGTPFPR